MLLIAVMPSTSRSYHARAKGLAHWRLRVGCALSVIAPCALQVGASIFASVLFWTIYSFASCAMATQDQTRFCE